MKFRTIDLDFIAPTLKSVNFAGAPMDPVLRKKDLAKGSILTLTFSETVQAGLGNIIIADCSPGAMKAPKGPNGQWEGILVSQRPVRGVPEKRT